MRCPRRFLLRIDAAYFPVDHVTGIELVPSRCGYCLLFWENGFAKDALSFSRRDAGRFRSLLRAFDVRVSLVPIPFGVDSFRAYSADRPDELRVTGAERQKKLCV